jgi:hypothetical protein
LWKSFNVFDNIRGRVHIMRVYKGYEGYKGDDLPKDMT